MRLRWLTQTSRLLETTTGRAIRFEKIEFAYIFSASSLLFILREARFGPAAKGHSHVTTDYLDSGADEHNARHVVAAVTPERGLPSPSLRLPRPVLSLR